MKRSEYREARDAHWRGMGHRNTLETLIDRDVRAAEAAGVTWDSEGPEVLLGLPKVDNWSPYRLLADGRWERWINGQWAKSPSNDHPVERELARRLLEESRQQEAVDSWNDKQAQAAEQEGDAIGRTLSQEGSLPGKLAWLDNEIDGPILVEGSTFRLDLSLAKLSPKEKRLLQAMVDLWNAWGEQGELRQKLAGSRLSVDTPYHDFGLLRSELLAKPWSES